MIYVLHLLRYCWTELATYFRDVMFSTISSLFLDICCRKIFKNWNIISTIYSNFWRHSILINCTFITKENNNHLQILFVLHFSAAENQCFFIICCRLGMEIKMMDPSFTTCVIKVFRKIGPFSSICFCSQHWFYLHLLL